MYWFGKLSVVSCLFAFNANIFAASGVEPTDRWLQELADYETAYNDMRQYFNEPVDETRVPSNATFLGVQDGYRRYQLPDTSAYLFGVTSSAQRKNLMEKIDFLFRLIYSCGQQYSVKPMDVQSTGLSKKEVAPTAEGFYRISQTLSTIANRLKNQDYVDERELNSLFTFINGAIDELNKGKYSNDLIDLMCSPIKEWITDSFPVSSMLKYIENRVGDLAIRASGGYNLSVNCAFRYGVYFNEYHSQTPEYKKITEWLDGVKAGFISSDNKITADQELKEFEHVITIPFDFSKLAVGTKDSDDLFAAFIRYVESIHQKGEALLEKWSNFIDAEKEEAERLVQERAAERCARTAKPKKADPKDVLAAMMRDLGLEEDANPKKASSKAKESDAKKPKPDPKKSKVESKAEIERQRQEAERARALPEAEEVDRLAQLEKIKRQNAERNAAAESRQAELRERRAQERHNRRMIMSGFLSRGGATWIEELYNQTQKLGVCDSSKLIDPSIFRGQPDYNNVINTLKAAGIYVKEHVHGNEKCVAMWKDTEGKNTIVWFDAPHGAQLTKGVAAGWVISLHKALRDSSRLGSE